MCSGEDTGRVLRSWDADLPTVEPSEDLFEAARSERCLGVVLDWGVSDLEGRTPLSGDLPVFYPLVGMLGSEVDELIGRVTRV